MFVERAIKRLAVVLLFVGVLSVSASGDRIVLKDGRVFEGTVTESEEKVLIEMDYGTISVSASEIENIERGPTPADLLEARLSDIDRTDPDALLNLAVWAKDNGLDRRAEKIFKEVLDLDSSHSGAHRLLGHVNADGRWMELPDAIQLAQGKLEAGKYGALLKELLPAIKEAAKDPKHKLQVMYIEAHCLLRGKQFDRARQCFEQLAKESSTPDSVRYAAVVEILKAHPKGMYVLTDVYPPTAMLLGSPGAIIEPGPASLARPEVLAAALRDHAKAAIKKGSELMVEGKKSEPVEPEAAKAKYALAGKCFDQADAIVPDIARSWRVEIARRRIAMITKDMNVQAGKFDALKASLGQRDMSPAAYEDLIVNMLRSLKRVRADLKDILELAGPFERELVLEITDATLHLQRVKTLTELLKRELNGK